MTKAENSGLDRVPCPKCNGWGEIPCKRCSGRHKDRWLHAYYSECRACNGEEFVDCDCDRGTVLAPSEHSADNLPEVDLDEVEVIE